MVVNLGTNDFSTAVNPGEPWTPDSLAAGYRSAYGDFLQKLRTRYGTGTTIVAVGAGPYAGHVQQVAKARNAARQPSPRATPPSGQRCSPGPVSGGCFQPRAAPSGARSGHGPYWTECRK
ncbi:hypothetical protein [Streptomyces sp. NBC_00190]|uniref:hypothetical protein n=1 Tax=Streptomyces sp. NBC_00190 TaxID=2903634 RepID=UPI003FA76554